MVLDVVLIVLLLLMMLYGYVKGFIGIVAKLVSVIIAFILAYLLSNTIGDYISNTNWGISIKTGVESRISNELNNTEQTMLITLLQDKIGVADEDSVINKISDYVFTGIGFVIVFIGSRIILWIAQKILESIFELPILKTFNKLGGVIAAAILFIIEVSIILAAIKSLSTLAFMSSTVNVIEASVITKLLYSHNIFTTLILSKII